MNKREFGKPDKKKPGSGVLSRQFLLCLCDRNECGESWRQIAEYQTGLLIEPCPHSPPAWRSGPAAAPNKFQTGWVGIYPGPPQIHLGDEGAISHRPAQSSPTCGACLCNIDHTGIKILPVCARFRALAATD